MGLGSFGISELGGRLGEILFDAETLSRRGFWVVLCGLQWMNCTEFKEVGREAGWVWANCPKMGLGSFGISWVGAWRLWRVR